MHKSLQVFFVVHYHLISLGLEFDKDLSFSCGDICADVGLIINFQCTLHIFTVMHLQSHQKLIITE